MIAGTPRRFNLVTPWEHSLRRVAGQLEERLRRFLRSHYNLVFASWLRKSTLLHFRRDKEKEEKEEKEEEEKERRIVKVFPLPPRDS